MEQNIHTHQNQPQPASIVVVDPDPVSLLTLAGLMHGQGYECICAGNVDAAIQASEMGVHDLFIWDVSGDAPLALQTLEQIRCQTEHGQLPAVLLAESRWAGLEKKAESIPQPTRCMFKPIDPHVLLAVVQQCLWMPTLVQSHRSRGTRPSRPGWVTL